MAVAGRSLESPARGPEGLGQGPSGAVGDPAVRRVLFRPQLLPGQEVAFLASLSLSLLTVQWRWVIVSPGGGRGNKEACR